MFSLLLSLLMLPQASEARSLQLVTHFAQVNDIKVHGEWAPTVGKVTYMQGCADFNPKVELSKPQFNGNVQVIKLRVRLSSHPEQAFCLAMPTEQTLDFDVPAGDHAPISVIADIDFDTDLPKVLNAELNTLFIQPGSELEKQNIAYASVTVDLVQKEIILTFQTQRRCPKNAFCIMSMPAPIIERVPLTEVRTGGCQEVIYLGSDDQRPVDGLLSTIRVIDNSKNYCESFRMFSPTEVQYSVKGGRPALEESHSFEGEKALR